ncbi:RNA methyltransferase [Georgenia sp. 311]|uniref:RNA methyltransferase n=1 Tax=Georgenia wutianyii TaxID=2585135 RepID=A0ABX5VPK9_9MICO|nr:MULTISPECIES: RNA methyltransferase [Georgenia]QDB80434.1 RNA methyltransferase [Georgenia wutianyii]TNC18363.1 RNA methyltransferase [Georgenia sp. 311]
MSDGTPSGETTDVGVGPWPGGPDAWPDDPRLDPELLAAGDRRNVVDRYRYWRLEAIVADLDTRRHPLHVAIENLGHDFNIGSVVRTANAFGVAAVHIVGRRRWNRRGAMVTDRYQHLYHHPDVADLLAWARSEDLPLIGIDNVPGSRPLEHRPLPERAVLLFGEESGGLSPAARAACQEILHITQYGSTRSMNVGAAAAVAMYAWALQHVPETGRPAPRENGRDTI